MNIIEAIVLFLLSLVGLSELCIIGLFLLYVRSFNG